MTDKELLDLAAKAVGYSYEWGKAWTGKSRIDWNPLEDDGDALRLAVKLHITIDRAEAIDAAYCYCDWRETTGVAELVEHGTDPYAATRRAVVRAAAAIGKQHGKD